ncbi:MAG: histidine--tRNA ligase [Anaerolineales bacterium]
MKNIIHSVKGTVDFYPDLMAYRQWMYGHLRAVSEAFGYQEYEGPIIEPLELYAAKSGEELVKKQSFVFEDRGGNMITLRPELTPTLARMVASKQNELVFPLRWWSYGPMWRYERPQKGRTREFFQWNIDLIGVDAPEADAELVAIGASLLQRLGITPAQVKVLVNNRRLVDSLLAELGIPPELRPEMFRLIDRRDKMAVDAWEANARELGLSSNQYEALCALLENTENWKKSAELIRFFEALEAMGVQEYVRYAPEVIRGLDYYTGTVFEARDFDGEFRAIFGGGRYDNLVGAVGGQPLPGVGFAMGDKVIELVLEKFQRRPAWTALNDAPVLVTVFGEEMLRASFTLAGELRQTGLKVAVYPVADKLAKQLKYADRIGSRVAIVLGPDELAKGVVQVKHLQTREQVDVVRSEAADVVRKMLGK